MESLISVIVPIYKAEVYLQQCLDSIINQTYHTLEIILVDDGSPDNCGKICDEFALNDNRIKVIHKQNGGQSDARNCGLQICQGDYIFFVDSDDFVDTRSIELLVAAIEKNNADIVIADTVNIDENSRIIQQRPSTLKICDIYNSAQAAEHYAQLDWGAWNKLYRRSVHIDIFFPLGKIHEDEAIMFKLIHNSSKIVHLHKDLYYYRGRSDSTTGNGYSLKKMDWFDGWCENVEYVKKIFPKTLDKAVNKMLITAIYNLDNLLLRNNPEEAQYIDKILSVLKKYRKNILKNRYVKYTKKIRVILLMQKSLYIYKKLYIKGI